MSEAFLSRVLGPETEHTHNQGSHDGRKTDGKLLYSSDCDDFQIHSGVGRHPVPVIKDYETPGFGADDEAIARFRSEGQFDFRAPPGWHVATPRSPPG